jgi:hypothetical protein
MWGMPFLTGTAVPPFLSGSRSIRFDKNGNFEYGTYREVLGEFMKTRPHRYVGLVIVY